MADGSGAPTVPRVGRYRFAMDKLGTRVACHGLNATGSVREQLRAAGSARTSYAEILARLPAEWHKANLALYADL